MAELREQHWQSSIESGLPKRERRSGALWSYIPDPLTEIPLIISAELGAHLSKAERAVTQLMNSDGVDAVTGLARFLLRSEAIASSQIEGITPSAKQVALAELAENEPLQGMSAQAEAVARNMTVVHKATTRLVSADHVTIDHIIELHSALLNDQSRLHGLRQQQNWIGGSKYHPLEADFVPPPPQEVPSLMSDLVSYLNSAGHSAIVQAGLIHAQFETIHPFADGNGRVGRALIHTVLARRGLTRSAILPISMVLATTSRLYVAGLTDYRYAGDSKGDLAIEGRSAWLATFADAVYRASTEGERLCAEVAALRTGWEELINRRRNSGGQRGLRRDSAVARIVAGLAAAPVLTAQTAMRVYGISEPAANKALSELESAGILTRSSAGRARVFSAQKMLDLVTVAERRLASTQFDTRVSPPNRPVPVAPATHVLRRGK